MAGHETGLDGLNVEAGEAQVLSGTASNTNTSTNSQAPARAATQAQSAVSRSSWRDVLPIHPAAEKFPLLSAEELRVLADDIKKNGLQTPIAVLSEKHGDGWSYQLLDGRNRLDAIALAGFDLIASPRSRDRAHRRREGMDCGLDIGLGLPFLGSVIRFECNVDDPIAYVISVNIHRRHFTAEQKRERIAELIKMQPEKSNNAIAKEFKVASDKTIAAVRAELEATSEIPKLEKTIGRDRKARKRPAKKQRTQPSKSKSSDHPGSGISEVSPPPEKLTGGLPTGSESSETSARQAGVVETQGQPDNPITEAWRAATREQQKEFVRDLLLDLKCRLDELDGEEPEDDGLDIPECLRRTPAPKVPA